MLNWRSAVATIALLGQAFSPVAGGVPRAGAFENDLRRSVTVAGHEQDRFRLADRMAHYGVPGLSVAIIDHCQIIVARGYGQAAVNGPSVTTRTLFQAASMSKPLASVAALRLVEQGKLPLDSDVRPLLRSWSPPRGPQAVDGPVTLRELLGHVAGTNVHGFAGYAPGTPLPTVAQILEGAPPANNDAVRIETAPGTTFSYSGGGYVILQALMSDATGHSFAELMKRLVLDPAEMRSSTYAQPLDAMHVRWAALGTGHNGAAIPEKWHVYPELAPAGLWTTPTDYARFTIALAHAVRGDDHRLLGPATARQLMRRGLGNWGLGVDLGPEGATRQFAHTGANAGFQSAFIMYPDTCQGAVVMTNSDEAYLLLSEVMDAVGEIYHWPDRKPAATLTSIPLSAGIVERFVGTYRLHDEPTEEFTISRKADGSLTGARSGYIGRDLLPQTATRLFSPDDAMRLEIRDSSGGKAKSLNLYLYDNVLTVADRVE